MLFELKYCTWDNQFHVIKHDDYVEKEKCFMHRGSRINKMDLLVAKNGSSVYFLDGDYEKAKDVLIEYYGKKVNEYKKYMDKNIEYIEKLGGVL